MPPARAPGRAIQARRAGAGSRRGRRIGTPSGSRVARDSGVGPARGGFQGSWNSFSPFDRFRQHGRTHAGEARPGAPDPHARREQAALAAAPGPGQLAARMGCAPLREIGGRSLRARGRKSTDTRVPAAARGAGWPPCCTRYGPAPDGIAGLLPHEIEWVHHLGVAELHPRRAPCLTPRCTPRAPSTWRIAPCGARRREKSTSSCQA